MIAQKGAGSNPDPFACTEASLATIVCVRHGPFSIQVLIKGRLRILLTNSSRSSLQSRLYPIS